MTSQFLMSPLYNSLLQRNSSRDQRGAPSCQRQPRDRHPQLPRLVRHEVEGHQTEVGGHQLREHLQHPHRPGQGLAPGHDGLQCGGAF